MIKKLLLCLALAVGLGPLASAAAQDDFVPGKDADYKAIRDYQQRLPTKLNANGLPEAGSSRAEMVLALAEAGADVAAITYVRLQEEFVYLAVVLDAYSRRVVGWALERTLETRLALAALDRAIAARGPRPGLVHHSDRGSQYASDKYVKRLEGIGAVLSMSRAGRPWENGKCERFMRTLKEEEVDARSYRNLEELQHNVEEFMETIYNRERLHAALKYLTPVEFEEQQAARPESAPWIPAGLSLRRHEEIYPDASGN